MATLFFFFAFLSPTGGGVLSTDTVTLRTASDPHTFSPLLLVVSWHPPETTTRHTAHASAAACTARRFRSVANASQPVYATPWCVHVGMHGHSPVCLTEEQPRTTPTARHTSSVLARDFVAVAVAVAAAAATAVAVSEALDSEATVAESVPSPAVSEALPVGVAVTFGGQAGVAVAVAVALTFASAVGEGVRVAVLLSVRLSDAVAVRGGVAVAVPVALRVLVCVEGTTRVPVAVGFGSTTLRDRLRVGVAVGRGRRVGESDVVELRVTVTLDDAVTVGVASVCVAEEEGLAVFVGVGSVAVVVRDAVPLREGVVVIVADELADALAETERLVERLADDERLSVSVGDPAAFTAATL